MNKPTYEELEKRINELEETEIELKKKEEELFRAKDRFEYLLSSNPSIIYTSDLSKDSSPMFVSKNVFDIQGYSPQEFLDDPTFWITHIYPDDRKSVLENLSDIPEKDHHVQEYRFLYKNGSYHWLYDEFKVMRDASNKPIELIGYWLDVTDRKKAEEEKKKLQEQLFQSKKMESIGRLSVGIANDLNNILSGMMGFSEILKKEFTNSDTKEGKAANIVFNSAVRAGNLIHNLLSMTMGETYQPVLVDVNKIIKDTSFISKDVSEKNIELIYNLQDNINTIAADENQLLQAFTNICTNAVDAMPDGGKLIFKTETVHVGEEFLEDFPKFKQGQYVKISFTDTGTGMTENVKDHIFEPFFTTKEFSTGAGLGLATVYGIIKNHNGHIFYESEPGKGTTFDIYLPVTEKTIRIN